MFFFDAPAVLFTVRILGASYYETRRANDSASILVKTTLASLVLFRRSVKWEKRSENNVTEPQIYLTFLEQQKFLTTFFQKDCQLNGKVLPVYIEN